MDLRWTWNHSGDELWRRLDPALWERTLHPNVMLQTVAQERVARALADPEFARIARAPGAGQACRRTACRAGFSRSPSRRSALLRRLFLHGIHAERGPADLFGRPWQRGGRPAQGRQQPGRARRGRRAALPAWLFPPGDRPGRRAAGALPVQRPRAAAGHAGPAAQRRLAAAGSRPARRLRLAAGLGGPGRPLEALPARLERRRPTNRPTGESPASSTAATRSCG